MSDNQAHQMTQATTSDGRPLVIFVLLSLLLHGATSLLINRDETTLSMGQTMGHATIVSVRLETAIPASPIPEKKAPPKEKESPQPPIQTEHPPLVQATNEQPTFLPEADPAAVESEPTLAQTEPAKQTSKVNDVTELVTTSEANSASHETLASKIKDAIHIGLADHFRYPPLARRRGWEGTVQVKLLITPEAGITHSEIQHSSGFSILDQAVLDALEEMRREDLPQMALLTRPLDMVVSVQYRLSDT